MSKQRPFWETKSLQEMTHDEWESLCDGCGRCCLIKLEDEITSKLAVTNVVCRYFDHNHGCCSEYQQRSQLVPECITLSPDNLEACHFMPSTCAYRLLSEDRPLPDWHPLITGSEEAIRKHGISVVDKVISEDVVHPDQLEEHIIDWL